MNAPATQSRPAPIVAFKRDLTRLKDAGELDMLPANVSFEAFRNAAVVAITDNPSILSCSQESVFKSIRKLAAAGLVPDGREAAIVPYKGQATAMPMVYGLLKIARNSGEISSIWAEVVREDEEFRISMSNGERTFDHLYDPMSRKPGKIKGAYAVAKLKDGTVEVETMGYDDIEKRRRASANQKGDGPTGIWQQWYDEMAKKTVIRALVKRLPMSSEDMRRVMVEHEDTLAPRDITPSHEPKVNLAQRIMGHGPDADPDPVQQDVLPPDDNAPATYDGAHWTDTPPKDAFPGSAAWDEGMAAFEAGEPARVCPYASGTADASDWLGGWYEKKEAKA